MEIRLVARIIGAEEPDLRKAAARTPRGSSPLYQGAPVGAKSAPHRLADDLARCRISTRRSTKRRGMPRRRCFESSCNASKLRTSDGF